MSRNVVKPVAGATVDLQVSFEGLGGVEPLYRTVHGYGYTTGEAVVHAIADAYSCVRRLTIISDRLGYGAPRVLKAGWSFESLDSFPGDWDPPQFGTFGRARLLAAISLHSIIGAIGPKAERAIVPATRALLRGAVLFR